MADRIVLVDTSILIEYFRKTHKSNTKWLELFNQNFQFNISSITEYEIYSGATQPQLSFWEEVLQNTKILAFDQSSVKAAVQINKNLKRKRK